MNKTIKRLWNDQEGQGAAEYGLILALVAVGIVVALGTLGDDIASIFEKISTELQTSLT